MKNAPLVVRVNAWKAKKQRENLQASTDSLDLTGVAKTLINRDAYLVFDQEGPHAEEYAHHDALRAFSRTRDSLVKARTAISNRIHNEIKLLFPGFLDEKNNPVSPFSKTSLALMARSDFHAGAFARKRPDSLAKILAKHRLSNHRQKAEQLITRAREALPPRPESIESHQKCLFNSLAPTNNSKCSPANSKSSARKHWPARQQLCSLPSAASESSLPVRLAARKMRST